MAAITTRRPSYRDNLETIDADLRAWADRLHTLVTAPLRGPALREVILIYANVASTFAYLEGSQRYLDYAHLMHWYDAFFRDRDSMTATATALEACECDAADLRELRRIWLDWLTARLSSTPAVDQRQVQLEADLRAILTEMDGHQLAFLERVGIDPSQASPSVVLADTASRIESVTTRTKLTRAWRRHLTPDISALTDVLDEAVELRRRDVRDHEGEDATILQRTFAECAVSEADVDRFLREFLVRSLKSQSELETQIRAATGCEERPMDHFGRYLRLRMGPVEPLALSFQACLEYLFTIARQVLGVTIVPASAHPDHALTFVVGRQGELELGTIDFDLMRGGASAGQPAGGQAPNHRVGAAGHAVHGATAHVLCPLLPAGGGEAKVTFSAAHSIFHEFGHAMTHVLLRGRRPGASGVEYLPLERLECASTWWEKWLYHPDFASILPPGADSEEALARARQARTLQTWNTTLQCALVAAMDFDVHRRPNGGYRESYERLSEEFSIGDQCAFADLPGYITHLTFQAIPGANFFYLWGAARSAEVFVPFRRVKVEHLAAHTSLTDEPARSWLDPALPSVTPAVDSYFTFLADVLDGGPLAVATR